MKRNWTMRVAVLMAVLALVTSCFVGGTFAKYVAKGEMTDTARVAKFGVTVEASTDKIFKPTYAKDDTSFTLATNTVVHSNADDLVAPGTKGSLVDFAITGKPEVAVRVSYKVTTKDDTVGRGFVVENWMVDHDADSSTPEVFYCPLVITVGTGADAAKIKGVDYASAEAFEDAVITAINNLEVDYKALPDLNEADTTKNISWEWPFVTGETDTEIAANDIKDTYLGDKAAEDLANAGTIELTIACAVTQID